MPGKWILCLAAAVTAFAPGCGWFDKSGDEGPSAGQANEPLPVPQARPPIADVPMPIGFDLDEGKSRNYAVSGIRWVDHSYKGRGDKFRMKRFFEHYMQTYRWTMTSFIFAQGRMVLDFEKDPERCRITISGGGWWSACVVAVHIWPHRVPPGTTIE